MTYSNQQNNKRAGYTFTIGDAVYYPSRNGMGYMVQGREGKVSFSQRLAQESEAYVVYTKGEDDTYRVYVYSKAEEAVVLKIKDVVRWRLVGNTLFYAKARIEYTISEYYPEDVYAVSLDTRPVSYTHLDVYKRQDSPCLKTIDAEKSPSPLSAH